MTAESFLEGHVRNFDWLGGVTRECVYGNLRSAVARRDGDHVSWNQRFLALSGHYAFHATACTPATPREKGSLEDGVRHLKTGFRPASRFGCLAKLDEQYTRWRDTICNRRVHATSRFAVGERLAQEREVLRRCRRRRSTSAARGRSASRWTATWSWAAISTVLRSRWFISASSCVSIAIMSGSATAA